MSVTGRWNSFQALAAAPLLCLVSLTPSQASSKSAKLSAEPRESDTRGRVTDVRFWSLAEATRIAVEVTSDFEFHYDRLSNPDRIFFDITGVKPARVPNRVEKIAVGDRFVKQIRIAESQPGTTRIVIDLSGGANAVASQLSNPTRLIIEIRPSEKVPLPPSAPAAMSAPKTSESTPARLENAAATTSISMKLPAASKLDLPSLKPGPAVERAPRTVVSRPSAAVGRDPLVSSTRTETPAVTGRSEHSPAPALAARRNSSGDRSMTRVLGLKLGRVVLDPGHGGHDGGTRGPTGLLEKDLVLDIAKRLGDLIESRLSSEVMYTRDDDRFIPLEERTRIANRGKADLFLSIHANSSPSSSASGIETYYLNFTTSKSALEVAARENASSERSIYDLRDLVQKIALKDKLEESREFAVRVQTSLSNVSARVNSSSKDRGVKKAPFVVLIGASMPSVLAEVGFLSNPRDEGLMKKPEYRQKIAEALYKGIAQYAAGLSHFQVARQKSME